MAGRESAAGTRMEGRSRTRASGCSHSFQGRMKRGPKNAYRALLPQDAPFLRQLLLPSLQSPLVTLTGSSAPRALAIRAFAPLRVQSSPVGQASPRWPRRTGIAGRALSPPSAIQQSKNISRIGSEESFISCSGGFSSLIRSSSRSARSAPSGGSGPGITFRYRDRSWALSPDRNSHAPPVGSKSQMIGAKEQGLKPACGCPLAYMRFARPSFHWQRNCKTMAQEFGALICFVTAKRSITWAAKAHMKLTFERIERNPRRRRFASASM